MTYKDEKAAAYKTAMGLIGTPCPCGCKLSDGSPALFYRKDNADTDRINIGTEEIIYNFTDSIITNDGCRYTYHFNSNRKEAYREATNNFWVAELKKQGSTEEEIGKLQKNLFAAFREICGSHYDQSVTDSFIGFIYHGRKSQS